MVRVPESTSLVWRRGERLPGEVGGTGEVDIEYEPVLKDIWYVLFHRIFDLAIIS